jgi:L-amino acid N-acyltransferase YncA
MRLRLVEPEDAEAIRSIYNHEVSSGTNTFDLVARSPEEQRIWVDRHRGAHPAIVAVEGGAGASAPGGAGAAGGPAPSVIATSGPARERVLGFAVVSPFRDRAAYATTVEDSVYVHSDHRGRGIGRALLDELLRLAAAHGFHAVIARISSMNQPSIRLHRACGFVLVGVEREVGRKHGHWLDVVELQRML